MADLNIYVITTCKGPALQKAAGYFLIENIVDGIPQTADGNLYRDKTTGIDLTIQLLCNALYIVSKLNITYDTLVISTKEPIVDNAFNKKWINEWIANDWKNKKGVPVSNARDWQKLCELLEGLSHRYIFSNENTSYFNLMEQWSKSLLKIQL